MEKSKKSPTAQAGEKYLIRFPDGMRDFIAAVAKENGRSMNAEILFRLEASLAEERYRKHLADNGISAQEDEEMAAAIEKCFPAQKVVRLPVANTRDDLDQEISKLDQDQRLALLGFLKSLSD